MTERHPLYPMLQELSGRWTIPILLNLKEAGGRFTPLQHRLDISPSRLSGNLKKMEEAGLVLHLSPLERRHPLLPEYQLTEKGLLYREAALAVRAGEREIGCGFLSERSWSWPVVMALFHHHNRFQDIRRALAEATPRILSMRIQELCQSGLAVKELEEKPRPGYLYLLSSPAEKPVEKLERELLLLV